MKSRLIGGARVSAVALGTASLSLDESRSADDADRTVEAAVEAGVDFLDTAAAYATVEDARHSERLVARALARHPHLFVATKGGHTRRGEGWDIDGSPRAITLDCERSLAELSVEQIDLYYLHKPDPAVPFLDSVGALADLQRDGKVARVGLSNVTVAQLRAARAVVSIDAVQNRFSPLDDADLDCLRACERAGIAYLPYSPLGGPRQSASLEAAFPLTARQALEHGISLRSGLLAWLLSLSDGVIPIVGASRPTSIADSATAADVEPDGWLRSAIDRDRAAFAR